MEPLARDEVEAALESVSEDLEAIEQIMLAESAGATSFLTEAATYLQKAGGKRIRPALTALSSRISGRFGPGVAESAAAIEMTHLATLYHDDVIDEAALRRGVPSVNAKWDNKVAILAGDFLFARASGLAAKVGGRVPEILANAIALVVTGQVRELEATYDVRRSTDHYLATIKGKTAALLEACTHVGALLAGLPEATVQAMIEFGSDFGFAFQVADDLLDLSASEEDLGKPPGTDLRDGVYTLPVIYAVEIDPSLAKLLGGPEVDVDEVRRRVVESGGFFKAREFAATSADRALDRLAKVPEADARRSLEKITELMVARIPSPEAG